MNDDQLITQYLAGDHAAFSALYNRHKGGVYRYLSRQLADQSLTDDLFQEVWGKVINALSGYQRDASFTTWLYTIARHKLIDHMRHIQVVHRVIDDTAVDEYEHMTDSVSLEDLHGREAQVRAIMHCLAKLPMHQRDCFLLKEETGLNAREIANVVNAGLEATKSRLRSAYNNLHKCLTIQLGGDNQHSVQEEGRI